MPEVSLTPVIVPEGVDDPGAADFVTLIELRNADTRRVRGNDEHRFEPAAALPYWQDQTDWRIEAYLARVDGEVVASCSAEFGLEPGATAGGMNMRVREDRWRQGIGSQLVPFLESRIRGEGRVTVQGWTEHPESPGERVGAATGAGSVPADHVARFLVRHGFVLEQAFRNSRLDVAAAIDAVATLTDKARAAAGEEYRTVSWEMPTPPRYAPDYAWMKSRMSTDAPNGGLDVAEEVWDADRVKRLDAKDAAGGFRRFTTAAEHVPTGRLVAFTDLYVRPGRSSVARQDDTLVVREHRGHSLGMLVKGELLLRLHGLLPDITTVETFNAEENRNMIAINETMGFTPLLYAGEWQKRLN
jgi:GNAT superfamily N-acetyltransferase